MKDEDDDDDFWWWDYNLILTWDVISKWKRSWARAETPTVEDVTPWGPRLPDSCCWVVLSLPHRKDQRAFPIAKHTTKHKEKDKDGKFGKDGERPLLFFFSLPWGICNSVRAPLGGSQWGEREKKAAWHYACRNGIRCLLGQWRAPPNSSPSASAKGVRIARDTLNVVAAVGFTLW